MELQWYRYNELVVGYNFYDYDGLLDGIGEVLLVIELCGYLFNYGRRRYVFLINVQVYNVKIVSVIIVVIVDKVKVYILIMFIFMFGYIVDFYVGRGFLLFFRIYDFFVFDFLYWY